MLKNTPSKTSMVVEIVLAKGVFVPFSIIIIISLFIFIYCRAALFNWSIIPQAVVYSRLSGLPYLKYVISTNRKWRRRKRERLSRSNENVKRFPDFLLMNAMKNTWRFSSRLMIILDMKSQTKVRFLIRYTARMTYNVRRFRWRVNLTAAWHNTTQHIDWGIR